MGFRDTIDGTYLSRRTKLNDRQKFFARCMLDHGFRLAKRMSGYETIHAYRLLRDPRIKEYMVSILREVVDNMTFSLKELIEDKYKLSRAKDTPAKVKNDIINELIEIIKEAKQETDRLTLPNAPKRPALQPAKLIKFTEIAVNEQESEPESEETNEVG